MHYPRKYSTVKIKAIRNPDFGLEEIMNMMKTIFINHSERSSVPTRSQEFYRRSRDGGREPTTNCRESAILTVITCHDCEKSGHKNKDRNQLNKRPGKSENLKSENKWCTHYHHNSHSNEDY